ncbi:VanZ family protein [Roseivirga pacifica]
MPSQRIWKLSTLLWAITLAILLLLPQESFPESELLSYDKLAHIGVFAILEVLLLLAFFKGKGQNTIKLKILTLTINIVYGSVLELLQQFSPGRLTDWYDFFANSVGALVGVIFFSIFIENKVANHKLIL